MKSIVLWIAVLSCVAGGVNGGERGEDLARLLNSGETRPAALSRLPAHLPGDVWQVRTIGSTLSEGSETVECLVSCFRDGAYLFRNIPAVAAYAEGILQHVDAPADPAALWQAWLAGWPAEYASLAPEAEAGWLRGRFTDPSFAPARVIARLVELGEFRARLSGDVLAFWEANWQAGALSGAERRRLLELLLAENFRHDSGVVLEALRRPDTADAAGAVCLARAREPFIARMCDWAEQEADRLHALRQSGRMSWNPRYRRALLDAIPPGTEHDGEMIPVWCLEQSDAAAREAVRQLLLDAGRRSEYRLQRQLLYWIAVSNPLLWKSELADYRKEIAGYAFLRESEVYLLTLGALVRCKDAEAGRELNDILGGTASAEERARIALLLQPVLPYLAGSE